MMSSHHLNQLAAENWYLPTIKISLFFFLSKEDRTGVEQKRNPQMSSVTTLQQSQIYSQTTNISHRTRQAILKGPADCSSQEGN